MIYKATKSIKRHEYWRELVEALSASAKKGGLGGSYRRGGAGLKALGATEAAANPPKHRKEH